MGHIKPAMVPIPLDIPMSILAYLGAMSKWFTLKPLIAKPENATPKVKATVAAIAVLAYATTTKNRASIPKPPQLNIFRTAVVDKIPFLRTLSASIPPKGTIVVIKRCGKAPTNPV